MLTTKRVIVATVCGFFFGIVCMLLASSNPNATESLPTITKWMIIISRTMMGFTIGVSAIRLNWWLHGIVLGAVASIPMALPILDRPGIAIGTIVMGIIYGFLTEVITSIFFKAKSVGRS
jgi:MFS family permease